MTTTPADEPAVLPDVDQDELPDDEPIDDDEGQDPYEGRSDDVQETGEDWGGDS